MKGHFNELMLSFSLLGSQKLDKNLAVFVNYFVLGRRGDFYIVNPYAVTQTLTRIFTLLKNIVLENKKFQKWVFSFIIKHAALCRWFGWVSGTAVYAKLTKNNAIISNVGIVLAVKGSMAAYTFLSYIGIDVAFVLSSKSSGGKAELLTSRSILTIGFDGTSVWTYAYNLPGTRNLKSAILYSRIFSIILTKIY